MQYVIHCLDHAGAVSKRLEHYDARKACLGSAGMKTVISGPLLADDEETMIGSCFVAEAGSLAEVEAFNHADPFFKAGLWAHISIRPFLKRVDNLVSFARAVRGTETYPITATHLLDNIVLLEAVSASALSGKIETVA